MRVTPLTLLALLVAAPAMASSLEQVSTDGWYTWRVTSHDEAPTWCCGVWSRGNVVPKACDLDDRHYSMNSDQPGQPRSGEMQIYIRLDDGNVDRVRTLSPHCGVEADSEIRDLGLLQTDESLDWLAKRSDSADTFMAVAVHEGERPARLLMDAAVKGGDSDEAVFALSLLPEETAVDSLKKLLENRRLDMRVREQALFWLVQSDSDIAYDYIDRLLTSNH